MLLSVGGLRLGRSVGVRGGDGRVDARASLRASPALGAEIQRTAAAEPRRAPREAAAAKCIVLTLGDT